MRGQGKRKKIKVDPSLAGGGDLEENVNGGAGDNLPGDEQHPLLNELVMEVLFKTFFFLNRDDPIKSALTHLAELRLVCKAWNQEIGKMIRKETYINVNKLISGYPKGLGWTATTTGDNQNERAFKYSVPMPKATGTFQNLTVTIKNCKDFTKTSILQWFQVMGSSVKSLNLTCTLRCYHQNRFVEKILKEWCPNLRSFTLRGAQCFESLIQNSFFAAPSLENECRSLKEFILFFDGLRLSRWSESCGLRTEDLEAPGENQQFQDIAVRKEINEKRSEFVKDLVKYIDQAGEATASVAQEEDLLNKLVRRPIGLTSLDGMTPRTFGSHVAAFFEGRFSCHPGHDSDGGIIGQLMKMSKLEKFVIQKANLRQEWLFNELFALFFYRPNLWSSSLQHFECLGHCPAVTAIRLHENNPVYMPPKNIFSSVGFPLKTLKFVDWSGLDWEERFEGRSLERILGGCAKTLEVLELGMGSHRLNRRLMFPVLPKLKVLVVESGGDHVVKVKVTREDILKLPKLERCDVGIRWRGCPATEFFEDDLVDGLCEDGGSHPLKELNLLNEYVVEKDIERLVKSFPNLKIVTLSIVEECGKVFKVFWEKMGELPLEQVKISFWAISKRDKDMCENAIRDNIEGFKDLEWLELEHKAGYPFSVSSRLSKGFAKAVKLRVLKFTNFLVDDNEAEAIKKNLADVVVELASVFSSAARSMK